MSMLLMGCGSAGGFNPLSLNPTLLALPENSFSDNGVTPAVDNDPVYFVNDASANDSDLTQVAVASRPLYKTADGGYWQFNGVNTFFTRALSIDNEPAITLATWFYVPLVGGRSYMVSFPDVSAASNGVDLHLNGANLVVFGLKTKAEAWTECTATVAYNNTWVHVAGTYDGITQKIYINGVLESSASRTGNVDASDGNINIGRFGTFGSYVNGRLDQVLVFRRALSSNEVVQLYNYGR